MQWKKENRWDKTRLVLTYHGVLLIIIMVYLKIINHGNRLLKNDWFTTILKVRRKIFTRTKFEKYLLEY